MSNELDYVPPKIWTWAKPNGGTFANINRAIAGHTGEKELPIGRHPLQLDSMGTPNGVRVTILLEELLAQGYTEAEYDACMIDIFQGDQFGSGFVALNPNSKISALVDRSGSGPISIFESGSTCCTWLKSLMPLSPKISQVAPPCSIGCSGKWVVLPI